MSIIIPFIVAVALWWGFTVAMLYRTGLPEASFPRTLSVATILAFAGLVVIARTADQATTLGAYAAFAGALLVWSWHEISYFLGFVTGPRPESCPEDCSNGQRFSLGIQASLYHELAIIATGGLLFILTFGANNRVALWTYCILWAMRWSAKLNIFLGVRNLHMDYLPKRLQYLSTYVAQRDMNPLFPISMLVSTAVVLICVTQAMGASSAFVVTGAVLCATLLSLAMLEHVFLMFKVPDRVLWRLGTGRRDEVMRSSKSER
ncbi:MAG: putative photosynthetic complex assembly protein PuhE [Gammaproteobacteria bacterium]